MFGIILLYFSKHTNLKSFFPLDDAEYSLLACDALRQCTYLTNYTTPHIRITAVVIGTDVRMATLVRAALSLIQVLNFMFFTG